MLKLGSFAALGIIDQSIIMLGSNSSEPHLEGDESLHTEREGERCLTRGTPRSGSVPPEHLWELYSPFLSSQCQSTLDPG